MAFVNRALILAFSGPQIASNKFRKLGDGKKFSRSFNLALENRRVPRCQALQSTSSGFPVSANNTYMEHAEEEMRFKQMMVEMGEDDPLECLSMIDAAQRLCIDHLFRKEIENVLKKQYILSSSHRHGRCHELHEVALRFRLLRQEGYYLSADDVFARFTDKDGNFDEELSQDIKGLLSLYEASHLVINGENILEKAQTFSSSILKARMSDADQQTKLLIENTLANPYHKSLRIFTIKGYFGMQHPTNVWINVFKGLAERNFKNMQTLHQQELLQVSRWWTDSGLVEELKFARDEIHNWYLWSFACIEDPNLSELRVDITKFTSLIYLIDDVYGNLEQLSLFTEAVCRWDLEATEQLPNCMKICFKTLHDLIDETSCKIYQKHGRNPIDSLKKAWASLCTAFLVEAGWFASGKEPSAEEYLNNGIISAGVHVLLIFCFFYTGQGLTRKNIQLVESFPPIVSSPATILRLLDDLGSSQKENENADEKDGSYIKIYLQEHPESSKEKAREHILRMVSKEWKNLNEACVSRHSFPAAFSDAALNSAKMVALIHNYDENQSLPRPEKLVKIGEQENYLHATTASSEM